MFANPNIKKYTPILKLLTTDENRFKKFYELLKH